MKFSYVYRDRENVRQEGVVDAPSRDEAFKRLRAQGIRPERVVLAPGLANRLAAVGKRGWSIVVLGGLCLGLCLLALNFFREVEELASQPGNQLTDSTVRRQVIGDSAIIQKGIMDGWSDVFSEEGERFLAGFAVPGVPVSVRNTSEQAIREALSRRIEPTAEDTLEARQIKAMVEGMKEELRTFLADGGTIVAYGQCLVQRQEEEIAHYNRAKAEIERIVNASKGKRDDGRNSATADLRAKWEGVNDRLRRMGIRLVPWPEE